MLNRVATGAVPANPMSARARERLGSLALAASALPVRTTQNVDLCGEEVLHGTPPGGVAVHPINEHLEPTPRHRADQDIANVDGVDALEVDLDRLSVLPQESVEATDSPSVTPRCF